MSFLLKIKHWQLFLLSWGVPTLISNFSMSNQAFPIIMVLFGIGTLGWVWAIATELNQKLPYGVRLNSRKFRIYFSIPILYSLGIILYMAFLTNSSGESKSIGLTGFVLVILHLLSMVLIFKGFLFAAKTMKTVELGRIANFGDYAVEFLLIWFSIIGYWILQPRLNRLIEK